MTNTILLDDYKTRYRYLEWVKQSFNQNDLFVTLNCPTIHNMSQFVNSKIDAIERTVFLRRPSNLYRFVMLVNEPQRHIHFLMSNVSNFKSKKYLSFKHLVHNQFSRSLFNDGDVDIKYLDNNIDAISRYILLRQQNCMIDNQSMFLPPKESFLIAS